MGSITGGGGGVNARMRPVSEVVRGGGGTGARMRPVSEVVRGGGTGARASGGGG